MNKIKCDLFYITPDFQINILGKSSKSEIKDLFDY